MRDPIDNGSIWNHKSRAFAWLFGVAGILALLGTVGWVLRVIRKVLDGKGLESYTTFWGLSVNYIAALVFIVCCALLLLAAPLLHWWGTREERDFKRKYGIPDENT